MIRKVLFSGGLSLFLCQCILLSGQLDFSSVSRGSGNERITGRFSDNGARIFYALNCYGYPT